MFSNLLQDDVLRFESDRLWLRWPEFDDARVLHDIAANAWVATKTASWPHPLPDGEAEKRIQRMRAANADGRAVIRAIILKTSRQPQRFAGLVGLHDLGDGVVVIGYLLAQHYSGQGLMTEALSTLLDGTSKLAEWRRLEASVRTDNPASARVLEKCGLRLIGSGSIAAPARERDLNVFFYAWDRDMAVVEGEGKEAA